MKTTEEWRAVHELGEQLKAIARHEGGPIFIGWPERWYENLHWRCPNKHVSTFYLKSEEAGASLCLECYAPITLTFPEDRDGPLVAPQMATMRPSCYRCGADPSCCPICLGAGETTERDQRALERGRRGRPEDSPPEAFDVPVLCWHCSGTGKHECLEHDCSACGELHPATYYDSGTGLHLCERCRQEHRECAR